ncbi:MAG: hypothetical protein NVS1B10_00040 [Candidatus Saccharimonadales bacterium]
MAKLMLVEDDNNLREIYEARLQAEGYTIVTASDGEEALVVAKAERPDLVISDVMMPKISGFEMLDIIRNTEGLKDVKIIMLTALGQTDDQQRADQLGADRYLVKSQVTLEDIVKVAHELLGDQEQAAPETEVPLQLSSTPETAQTEEASPAEDVTFSQPPQSSNLVVPEPPQPELAQEPMVEPTVIAQPNPVQPASQPAEDFTAGAQEEVQSQPNQVVQTPETQVTQDSLATPQTINAETPPIADNPVQQNREAEVKADDQLMADALISLSPDDATKPPEPITNSISPPANQYGDGSVNIANKKIITPIDSAPKKDLESLLAIEAEKEAGIISPTNGPGIPSEPVTPPSQTTPPTPPAPERPNISL